MGPVGAGAGPSAAGSRARVLRRGGRVRRRSHQREGGRFCLGRDARGVRQVPAMPDGRGAHLPEREDHRSGCGRGVRRVRGDSGVEHLEAGCGDSAGVCVDSGSAGECGAQVLAGEVAGRTIAITGCGPIGLFAIAVARAVGAAQVYAIEVNQHRRNIARQMKVDLALDPSKDDVNGIIMQRTGGAGVDAVLEMAGHRSAIRTAFDIVRRGGRISLLGLTSKPVSLNFSEDIIFKGLTIQGINGRRMYQTWFQMTALLKAGKLDLHPVITDRIAMKDFSRAMERLKTGEASKILVYPNGAK